MIKNLGKYELIEEIGRGGFAAVYRARDIELDRIVALKVLHPQHTIDPRFIERFRQEAQVAASLRHAHIITIHEVGAEAGQHYLAMAFLSGQPLNELLVNGPLPVEQAVAIIEQIGSALDAVHAQGLVHRDVKPANIMIDEYGQAILLDFGIVRAAEGTRLTTTMKTLGTPEYMAPEQAELEPGVEVDGRADIYALGIVAYELLVGHPPFTAKNPTAVLYKHIHEPPPAPSSINPNLSSRLERPLLKALAKSREDRFQRASDFAAQLRRALQPQSKTPKKKRAATKIGYRPPWLWLAGGGFALALLLICVGVWFMWPPREETPASTEVAVSVQEVSKTPDNTLHPTLTPTSEPVATSTETSTPSPQPTVTTGDAISAPLTPTPSAEPTATPTVTAPTIISFTADQYSAAAGDSVTLQWELANAQAAYLQYDGIEEDIPASGSKSVAPEKETKYTLVARNEVDETTSDVVISILSPTATPTLPAGRIAFQSNRDGNYEIYTINPDGSGLKRLTDSQFSDTTPSWSPDGLRLAFASDKPDDIFEIYVMNADGSEISRLTTNSAEARTPAWSPDGTRITFVSNRDGDDEIYVMNADGSEQTRLTYDPGEDRAPVWSPDGARITFNSNRDGDFEIYVMNADGSDLTQLTNSPVNAWPAWSPDGEHIAFNSNRDGDFEIYIMNIDGTDLTQLTNNSASDIHPSWSPDSTHLTFHSDRHGNKGIYVISTDGNEVIRLTNNSTTDQFPSWSRQ